MHAEICVVVAVLRARQRKPLPTEPFRPVIGPHLAHFEGPQSDPWTRPNRVLTNSEMKMQGSRRCSRRAQGELTRFWQWALAKNAAGHVGSHQRAPRAVLAVHFLAHL
jgi:hypothetical protein